MSRITKGFAWNYFFKIVEIGGVNLYSVLVVRAFGPAIGGNYALYMSVAGTLGMVTAFAVDGVLLKYIPRISRGESQYGEKKIEGLRPFLIELFAFRLLVTIVVSSLVAIALGVLPSFSVSFSAALGTARSLWPYIIVSLFGQALTAFSMYTMLALLEVRWVFFASLITRIAMLTLGTALIAMQQITVEKAVALHAFSALFNGALLVFWTYKTVDRKSAQGLAPEVRTLIGHFFGFVRKPSALRVFLLMPFMLYGITTWGSDILSTVLGRQPDILMIRAIQGENAPDIGLYEASARLVLMTEYIFLFGLSGTLVSVFSELAHKDEEANDGTVQRRFPRLYKARRDIASFQTVTTAPLFLFMLLNAPLAVEAIYGPKFAGAIPMVQWGLSILFITVAAFAGGMQITSLVVIGKERVVFLNRLCWGILNLVGNYFLILHFGGLGAIIGTQVANAGAVIVEGIFARRWIGSSFDASRTVIILSIASLAVATGYSLSTYALASLPALLRFGASGILTGLVTIALYLLFRVREAKSVITRLRGLVSPA
jgi:O-antigen/teichoic acid export membrane protein